MRGMGEGALSNDRLDLLEAAMRQLIASMNRLNEQGAALARNDERLARALSSIDHRLALQEAGNAMYEVASGATKGAH